MRGDITEADVDVERERREPGAARRRGRGRAAIHRAGRLPARSVAFPAISAGIYGWPLDDAGRQAVTVVRPAPIEHVAEVRFVLFSDDALAAFGAALSG